MQRCKDAKMQRKRLHLSGLIGALSLSLLTVSMTPPALHFYQDPTFGKCKANDPTTNTGCASFGTTVSFNLVSQQDGTCTSNSSNTACRFVGTASASSSGSEYWVCLVDSGGNVTQDCWNTKKAITVDPVSGAVVPATFSFTYASVSCGQAQKMYFTFFYQDATGAFQHCTTKATLPCGNCDLVQPPPE
jgi:hypothetical protein